MRDFYDSYSYYLMKKKLATKEDEELEKEDIVGMLEKFNLFTSKFDEYPTREFNKIRLNYVHQGCNLLKLSQRDYNYLMREYYLFFDEVLATFKEFVDVCSFSGFLPNTRIGASLRSIGYAKFDEFFIRLEDLKMKMSRLTRDIQLVNLFKSRRCCYSMLLIFSPYFRKVEVYEELTRKLDFEFIYDDSVMSDLRKSLSYETHTLPLTLKERIDKNVLDNLKITIALIKRYISYELGERDISPKIKKKYAYDPTGV